MKKLHLPTWFPFIGFCMSAFFIMLIHENNYAHNSEHNDIKNQAVVNDLLNFSYPIKNNKPVVKKVVIDAGHGGKDHGCSGPKSKEKYVALDIAKALGKKINAYHPEIEVIYTREQDVFIPLYKRIQMANKENADLFISIHCNYIDHKQTGGTETFVMGLHKVEENLSVAKRENASILYEKNFKENYQGYDPHSTEGHIILSMYQNAHLDQSILFAEKVESSFNRRTPLKSRGVKQAGFVVLHQAAMPSVLIETGFLSNAKNESYLKSTKGQDEVSQAIVLAFSEYLREIQPSLALADNDAFVSLEANLPENENEMKLYQSNNKNEVSYKIQIAASLNKPIPQSNDLLYQIADLEVREESNMYKYLTGDFESLEEASMERTKMRAIGFKGAFIVAYKGNQRVKL